MSWETEVDAIRHRKTIAAEQGGADAVAKQHAAGRLTIRERIDRLADTGSFREQGPLTGHAEYNDAGELKAFTPGNYVLGIGTLDGRRCVIGGEDFTLRGGSPSPAGLRKSVYAEELALQLQIPLVRLLEGAGGSVTKQPGPGQMPRGDAVNAAPRFQSIMQVMGAVPVVSAALGPVAGFPAARLVASHFSVMTRDTAQVMIGGPALVERALGQTLTKEELGGAAVHLKSGVVDNVAEDENDALRQIRRFLSYLPLNVWEQPPPVAIQDDPQREEEALLDIVPEERRKSYKMRRVIDLIVDRESFFELAPYYGRTQITGLARLNGESVGILANDPYFYAGAMTAEGAQKVRRFVDLCDTFHLPIVSLVDEPGFMIGPESEKAATIRHGTATLFSVMQSSVPWASVIVRKVYGVAGAAHFGPGGYVLSWPSAEAGALPIEGGVAVAFRREIAEADDPDAKRRELEGLASAGRSPFPRAEAFGVHDLIDPRKTRGMLCDWMDWTRTLRQNLKGGRAYSFRP